MRGQSPQDNVVSGNIPNLSQFTRTDGHSASTSGLPRGIYSYQNVSGFPQMKKEEIKDEPGDSPIHNPSNQYQLQPMQGMLTAESTSPGPDRSPSTLTPSPGIGGPISPLDPGNVTPTPPAYTTLGGPVGNLFGTFATNFGNGTAQQQPNASLPIFETNLPGPSNGWVQPVPLQNQNVPSQQQSFNLGNFGSLPLTGESMLTMNTTNTIPTNNSLPNVGPLSMGSDLNFMNLDFTNLEPFNSSEIRSVLGTLSTTELNRLEHAANMQTSGNYQQNAATSNQQQTLKTLLATQQQQPQQEQGQTLPDRNDNDEDLTDSFTKLSTNDLN
ncbi:uncharacterized protein LOC128304624 [Anopheles moucheti]|uniref:uncharacterized protein LOC128304624 n=1 Tax=Anopheles moucheti TaxID=186751 RepID=UPI0022F03675|nr:uncharacterized protein LOC128304624 [Anopheles moucheti]